MTDFRALCDELTDALDYWLKNSNLTDGDARDLVEEARAALAQPEPETPTHEEIISTLTEMQDAIDYDNAFEQGGARDEMLYAYDLIERLAPWVKS